MAKILECGAAAVAVRTAPDCMMAVLHEDSFDVFPLREDYHCTPQSVASHTLYENADPFELKEPSGTLRTNNARYEAISERAVRVSGSEFVHDPEYTIKLEGVRQVGYSTILMGGSATPISSRRWTAGSRSSTTTLGRASATRSANGHTRSSPASMAATASWARWSRCAAASAVTRRSSCGT
jgi:hypothetical protein